jgi:hypothetical protein
VASTEAPVAAGWRCVAGGADAGRCASAAAEIASELAALAARTAAPDPTLSGAAGWALALHHAGRRGLADPGTGAALARRLLAEVPRRPLAAGLYNGFTGPAWLRAHLDPASAATALRTVDARLVARLRRPWTRADDLLYGLAGFGAYLADRLPDPLALEGLGLVVRRLDDLAERRADGTITWVSRSRVASEPDEPARYDLGVAHGVPGTIALLATAVAHGAEPDTAAELLSGAVAWVRSELRPASWSAGDTYAGARLPFYLGSWEGWERPSRLAWCYGDASAALALAGAADVLGDADAAAAALDLALAAARRQPATTGVRDAALCHGTAGLALVFARLAEATGAPELHAAAATWLERTLALRRPGDGFAGYRAWMDDAWVASPSFLAGAAGIALALLALSDPEPPTWDRLLLLRPPRA